MVNLFICSWYSDYLSFLMLLLQVFVTFHSFFSRSLSLTQYIPSRQRLCRELYDEPDHKFSLIAK